MTVAADRASSFRRHLSWKPMEQCPTAEVGGRRWARYSGVVAVRTAEDEAFWRRESGRRRIDALLPCFFTGGFVALFHSSSALVVNVW
nr:hypothetical protein Iba_chr03aCG3160 [Ipomoea batatas]